MDGIEDDDGYSDEDLDALPAQAFHELQQDAIRSTQQPRNFYETNEPRVNQLASAAPYGNLGGFDRLSLDNGSGAQHLLSSDYGDIDDEMLNGEIFDAAAEEPNLLQSHVNAQQPPGESTQREAWRHQRYSNKASESAHRPSQQLVTQAIALNQPLAPRGDRDKDISTLHEPAQRSHLVAAPPQDLATLQAKLEELARENERLKRDYDAAKTDAFSKTGEIAIVRANRLKEKQDEEKRLEHERKLRVDEQARYNAEVHKYKAELQKISTDKAFIENDLVREAEQRKGLQRKKSGGKSGLPKALGKENTVTTPKKGKAGALGDGFDEEEVQVQVQSPSKLALRSKPATPKQGAKRKRQPTENSPVKPLLLSQTKNESKQAPTDKPAEQRPVEAPTKVSVNEPVVGAAHITSVEDHRFEFTQKVLNHRIEPGAKRSIEALAAFSLPSKPDQVLSTLFYDGLAALSMKRSIDSFPAALCLVIVDLWSQSLNDDLYKAVKLLMDLTAFILSISPLGTAAYLTDELASLVQRTADINLIPRIRRKPPSSLTAAIDTKQCLEILHLMVYNVFWQPDDLERFWRCMRVDFIAMALKIDQPIEEIHIAIDMLRTSVTEKTFAMVRSASDGDQESSEQGLIQIISSLFIENPRVLEGREPYELAEICQLRLEALGLLERMCETEHGSEALAKCPNVFIRLIRFMNEELENLYDFKDGHGERIEMLNLSTRLLYHLSINYPEQMNIQERLAATPGAAHKYLIVLTRLNFSDGVFLEEGIEDDVVERAQHMLENWVTPEEGEALVEAFSSARK